MMLILTAAIVFTLLAASELWWRFRKPHDEVSRKFIHITVGSFAAFWPYFLSWGEILLLSAAFVVVVGISKYFDVFRAIHAVERPTWGEVCFGLAVGAVALLTQEPLVYTIALLHMSLADGLAAIVGVAYGKTNSYTVFGHTKSLAGTGTFFAVSITLLATYTWLAPVAPALVILLAIALGTAALENVAVKGIDNLLVPLFVAVLLTLA